MDDAEKDQLMGTVLAAMTMSQLALSEVMKISPEVKERVAKTAQQMIDVNRSRSGAHKIAGDLMQGWLDLAVGPCPHSDR